MELGSVTLNRIGFFCFPIKHSTHTLTRNLWVRSRSLAATRGRSGLHSTPGLASTARTVPGNTPGSHGPGNPPGFTMIHLFPTLGFDPRGTRFMMNFLTGELFLPSRTANQYLANETFKVRHTS
jgi:hypothetical protein